MMILGFRELPDAVHEVESFTKSCERERALERSAHLVPCIRFSHATSIDDRARPDDRHSPGRQAPAERELVVAALFGPVAERLAGMLAPLRVPPPAVVLANAAAGLAAALLVYRGAFVSGALVLQLKTVLDNADGRLARISGRVTLFGRYLDTEADLVVNAALFAALGSVTGETWLALAGFIALTLVLSANHNANRLYAEARGDSAPALPRRDGPAERTAELFYRVVFEPHDRIFGAIVKRRLARLDASPEHATSYHDRATMHVLANLGLSTQLVVLGLCLVAGAPEAYLWLAVGAACLLPLLQLRRERLVRRAVSERRAG